MFYIYNIVCFLNIKDVPCYIKALLKRRLKIFFGIFKGIIDICLLLFP